jgi:acyl-CoA ligase (AMP-forming) (exosortase A-associated)
MSNLIHEFINQWAKQTPNHIAIYHANSKYCYSQVYAEVASVANGLVSLGLLPNQRCATYIQKLPQTVFALFGTAMAGGVFVPINPLLKSQQVTYILRDCNIRILFTSADRFKLLYEAITSCPDLQYIVLVDEKPPEFSPLPSISVLDWNAFTQDPGYTPTLHRRIDIDMAAILYTSGSTGQPKGVVLSHRNLVAGAQSVATYLQNTSADRILTALPLSFDYGLSQLTTAFSVGASVTLMDYLLPKDVLLAVERYRISGLAGVPSLWIQLVQLERQWETVDSLRYITNSGGIMPKSVTFALRKALPKTDIYLMYGLTEAFRSTYLSPDQITTRPDSIGKAIPNADIEIVREDGAICKPGEVGELVHRGALVALGYWNNPAATAKRFRPAPKQPDELSLSEVAVWSGDQVTSDEEGYLYFIGRLDEMIKTSGYRVSPSEIEETLYDSGLAEEVAAIGIPHSVLGQAILLVLKCSSNRQIDKKSVMEFCQKELPNYMVPKQIIIKDNLPKNKNGKINRRSLYTEYQHLFVDFKHNSR